MNKYTPEEISKILDTLETTIKRFDPKAEIIERYFERSFTKDFDLIATVEYLGSDGKYNSTSRHIIK